MPEVIVFPAAEPIIISYLNTEFAARGESARAASKVPNPRPASFVRIIRTGGPADFVIDRVQLTVEAWGGTEAVAAALIQLTRGLLHAIDQVTYNGSTYQFYDPQEFSGPANLPDPDSAAETARFRMTFSLGVRGTSA